MIKQRGCVPALMCMCTHTHTHTHRSRDVSPRSLSLTHTDIFHDIYTSIHTCTHKYRHTHTQMPALTCSLHVYSQAHTLTHSSRRLASQHRSFHGQGPGSSTTGTKILRQGRERDFPPTSVCSHLTERLADKTGSLEAKRESGEELGS